MAGSFYPYYPKLKNVFQEILTAIIILASLVYLVIRIRKNIRKKRESACSGCDSDCTGCPVAELKHKSPVLQKSGNKNLLRKL